MPDEPGFWTILRRTLRRRCPVCGGGRIFRTYLRLEPSCTACGWLVERQPGAVTGAMYLISIFTQLFAAALFFAVWLLTDWSPWTKIAVVVPIIVVFSLIALPASKSLWIAVEYFTDIKTGETRRDTYRAVAYRKEEGL